MSESWNITPEPTEEELVALVSALAAAAPVQPAPEADLSPMSAWRRTARRESVASFQNQDEHWNERR